MDVCIIGLMKLISDNAPTAIKQRDISYYFGRSVAIDASMAMYQFLVFVFLLFLSRPAFPAPGIIQIDDFCEHRLQCAPVQKVNS